MILKYACVDGAVHRVYSDRMQRKLMEAIAFSCAAHIVVWLSVTYVGFLTVWNEENFDKSMVYKKNHVVIVRQHFVVDPVRFVKKLAFLNVEVD